MIEYELIRSLRKTISISVAENSKVIVKAPVQLPVKDIEKFIIKHVNWIEKTIKRVRDEADHPKAAALTDTQISELKRSAKSILPEKVAHFSAIMNVRPAEVKITSAKKHWGSCIHRSGGDNICFSYRVMLLPDDLIDYIVVHELAHINVQNHGAEFYREVAKYMPDYQAKNRRLRQAAASMPK